MNAVVDIILPRTISVNDLWRISGKRLIRSEAYKSWLTECGWEIRRQKARPVTGRYRLKIEALKTDKRRKDIDNIIKAASDLLVEMQIVPDDSLCDGVACDWVSSGPPLRITITPIEE